MSGGNISVVRIFLMNKTYFSVLPLDTASLQYSELICPATMCCVLRVIFSGIFLKCLQVCLVILKIEMAELKEQACVKFCFLLGKTAAETITMFKEAVKDEVMGKTQVYK